MVQKTVLASLLLLLVVTPPGALRADDAPSTEATFHASASDCVSFWVFPGFEALEYEADRAADNVCRGLGAERVSDYENQENPPSPECRIGRRHLSSSALYRCRIAPQPRP
jgi:hypothetical protein